MVQQAYRPDLSILGPQHHGLRVSAAEFERAAGEDGYRFELIDGVIHVSPAPHPYAQNIADAVFLLLKQYRRPDGAAGFAEVVTSPRVFISADPQHATVPEPDVAAYAAYPRKPVASYVGVIPVLVVEVTTPSSRDKDYLRNQALYAKAPEILEYWIIDPTVDMSRPSMTVFRRASGHEAFGRVDVAPGGAYSPDPWPGLRVDLERIATA